MKFVSCFLFITAFAVYTEAHCDQCATEISSMDPYLNAMNYTGLCIAYKKAHDCNTAGGCDDHASELLTYVQDFCQKGTATLTDCGNKISSCVLDLQKTNAAAASQNKKLACSDAVTFFTCSSQALTTCNSKNTTLVISQLRAAVTTLGLEIGCTGECAAAAGSCLAPMSADSNAMTMATNATLFKDLCRKLGTASSCMTSLQANECSGNQTNMDQAAGTIKSLQDQIRDICDANGRPTACVEGFIECGTPLKSITNSNACSVMANYMTCAERLPCKHSIETQIKQQEATVDAALLKNNCPVTGGCKDRLQTCINKTNTDLAGVNRNTDINKFCQLATSIENCFLVVRNDPNCVIENYQATNLERQFFADFQSKCGNVTACEISIIQCKKDYKGVTANSPIADKCSKVGKAVGCVNSMVHSDICVRLNRTLNKDDQNLINVYNQDCGNAATCEAGVNACMGPVKGVIGDPDSAKATDCPIIKTAVTCLDTMRLKPVCKLVQQALLNGENQIRASDSKICGGSSAVSGNSSACETAITNCKKDYQGLSKNSPIADKCMKVGKAVGCIGSMLKSVVCLRAGRTANQADQTLINEYENDCGSATACETGVNACLTPAVKGVIGDPDSAKDKDCPIIKGAVSCLDRMRQKPICKLVQTELLVGESKIREQDGKLCGGNAGVSVQASILVVTVTLIASFWG